MKESQNNSPRNVLRGLSQIEAAALHAIWKSGGFGLTYAEIEQALAVSGYTKTSGYIRRIISSLEDWQPRLLDRSVKPGPKRMTLAFSIPKDTVNSRPTTSRILLELLRHEDEEHESPERQDFILKILAMNLRKKPGDPPLTKPDIEKALEFCEEHEYIKRTPLSKEGISAGDRTKKEQPFITLIALEHHPPATSPLSPEIKSVKGSKKKPRSEVAGAAKKRPVLKTSKKRP